MIIKNFVCIALLVLHIYVVDKECFFMIFFSFLSILTGYILNEEVSVNRICCNLSYDHEGWLLLCIPKSIWLFGGAFFISFLKGYYWGILLLTMCGNHYFYIAGGLYVIGNIIAVHRCRGLFYTPWLALGGIIIAYSPQIVQGIMTVIVVSFIITKKFKLSMITGFFAYSFLVLLNLTLVEGVYWNLIGAMAWFFSRKQSPFKINLIK